MIQTFFMNKRCIIKVMHAGKDKNFAITGCVVAPSIRQMKLSLLTVMIYSKLKRYGK